MKLIPKECDRLIEVDFPLATVSAHAAHEKKVFSGHPSMLNQWWARRPLASCRAVLLGLLLPDPCHQDCPDDFKSSAREILGLVQGKPKLEDLVLRKALLKFIGDFANWNLSANQAYLEVARRLIMAAYPEEAPLVVDPFAGGGSIPLEALRLGCEAFASDLNPVACLINKVLLEELPRYSSDIADELWKVGMKIKAEAEQELSEFYPPDPDGARPLTYLWARTVRCESPNCGAEIPLVRSFWLAKRAKYKVALRYNISRREDDLPYLKYEIFVPDSEQEVPSGTVARAKARCPACGAVLAPERVRAQLVKQKGGADVIFDKKGQRTGGAFLLAVIIQKPGETGRKYRLPTENDYFAIFHAAQYLQKKIEQNKSEVPLIPNEPMPWKHGHRAVASPRIYAMTTWGDLFSSRQKLSLVLLTEKVRELIDNPQIDSVIIELLAFNNDRLADKNSSLTLWEIEREVVGHVFNRQALPMIWDFAETAIFTNKSGSYESALDELVKLIRNWAGIAPKCGQIQIADACNSSLPNASCDVWFTDPPYYDNVAYADLSDFFFVWLKRALVNHPLLHDPFDSHNQLTPKNAELTVTTAASMDSPPKDSEFFLKGMQQAFNEGERILKDDGVGCVVFAHKTTEGWEALLSGMQKAGWTITASWPIRTERPARILAQDTASLATSVHLICRPRPTDAGVGDWSEVKTMMEQRIQQWMIRLLDEGIRGADAVFSCIGPALEVYSRFERVETPAGHVVPLGGNPEAIEPHERGFLAYVFEAVSRNALRHILGSADTEGFEEDARMTALFLWTLQTTSSNGNGKYAETSDDEDYETELLNNDEKPFKKKKGSYLPFDTFIRITRPMGIHYQNWLGRVIEIEKGIVRLFPVAERRESLFEDDVVWPTLVWESNQRGGYIQEALFEEPTAAPRARRESGGRTKQLEHLTTLDRLHWSMLLFGAGDTVNLTRLLEDERRQGRRFELLALALTALYPDKTQERRWLEGVQTLIRR